MPIMTDTTRRFTYRGDPAAVSLLVQMLREAGATVEWEPPTQQRGIGEMVQEVVVGIVATGSVEAIKAAIAKFLKHMHGKAEATIEDDEQDDEPGD